MIYKELFLEDIYPGLPVRNKKTLLSVYMQEVTDEIDGARKSPCVVICPGGGYSFTSRREAEPLALHFLGKGINSVICWYCCEPDGARWPDQLLETSAAVATVRRNSNEWGCDPDRIAVMGFSAGGHVAGTVGVFWQEKFIAETLGLEFGENKPNGMILCYPVLTSGEKAHRGSIDNLLGPDKDNPEMVAKMSLENQVSEYTPKAFLWHTDNDGAVPVENSLMMASALHKAGKSVELHIYPDGVHGLSLCDETTARASDKELINPYAASWFDHCADWVKKYL